MLRALTDCAKDEDLGCTGLSMGGINFGWLVGCLGSESRLALSRTGVMRRLSGAYVKPPRLEEGSAGRAPTLHRIPWHLPYN